jgi:hypothetical protein
MEAEVSNLPPMAWLRAFEAAAVCPGWKISSQRCQPSNGPSTGISGLASNSSTDSIVGVELNVSPSTISHQVRDSACRCSVAAIVPSS